MQLFIIFLVLCFAAGVSKAFRDTIKHHWLDSWISVPLNIDLFNWLHSDWEYTRRRQKKLGWYLWFAWDGWHFFDTLQIVLLIISGLFIRDWWNAAIGFCAFGCGFELFYSVLLMRE